MGKVLILSAYAVYAAFWTRFLVHAVVWWRAVRVLNAGPRPGPARQVKIGTLTLLDIFFLGRLLRVNPALWLGEWGFHAAFLLVLGRHLRYFLNPVPEFIWALQTPGLIAGYLLPVFLVYILALRLLTRHEKYASRANIFLLGLVLAISCAGVLMHVAFTPDLVDVKLFAFGIVTLSPVAAPGSLLFALHFVLVLVLVLLLPSHIFTAPLVMLEARKREQTLHDVMHEPDENDRKATKIEPRSCEVREEVYK